MVTSTPRRSRAKQAASTSAAPATPATSAAKPAAPNPARTVRTPRPATAAAAPKPTTAVEPAPAVAAATEELKLKKVPMVRDSFTMPQAEYALIATLKARSLQGGRHAKKSELLRAGLQLLTQIDDATLSKTLEALPPIKVGRPKKSR